jgi:hypothetical protein
MSGDPFLWIFWMIYVGNITEESNRFIKRTKKVHGAIEHIKKQFSVIFCAR